MAPHSSTLAWKIPWTEEPGRLQSMGSLRVGHDWATSLSLFTFMPWRRKWQPTPVFLPGESQGQGEPGGLPCMGLHRVRHDWSDLAAAAAAVCTCQCSSLHSSHPLLPLPCPQVCCLRLCLYPCPLKKILWGLPCWSSGWNSELPVQGAWVRSLVREPDLTCWSRSLQAVTRTWCSQINKY